MCKIAAVALFPPLPLLCHLIAERLSTRQLILLCTSFCVCMYVCMSIMLRNARFLYTVRAGSSLRRAHAAALLSVVLSA